MERRGRKPAGVTNLELMRALPGAPEEDIEGLMEMVDQGEANNAQLRDVTYRAKQVLKDSLHLGQTKAECTHLGPQPGAGQVGVQGQP